jgi:hypothetical protein
MAMLANRMIPSKGERVASGPDSALLGTMMLLKKISAVMT